MNTTLTQIVNVTNARNMRRAMKVSMPAPRRFCAMYLDRY
jgi:hypothetical protein